jgi:CheY-like chemotaxis protein
MSKILVIDDDNAFRIMLCEMLTRVGHEVIPAVNGKEGIDRYRETRADLVITDILMPEKDGVETIFELQKDFPEARVVAISGGGRKNANDYLKLLTSLPNVKGSLAKPFSKEEMIRVIEEAIKN